MRRLALGAFAVAVAATGAVLIVSLLSLRPVGQPVRPPVVRGQLTGARSRPARRARVWLNAVPVGAGGGAARRARQPAAVTVTGS